MVCARPTSGISPTTPAVVTEPGVPGPVVASRLKILIVGINYRPESTGIAPYTGGMAEALAARGHQVEVVTGYPHYPEWRIHDGFTGHRARVDELSGVKVTRLRHYVPPNPTTLTRALMEIHFGLRATLRRWSGPDVVVVVSPALLAAWLMSQTVRRRAPVVTWMQDIYTLGLGQSGASTRGERWVRTVESSLLRRSALVVAIHNRFAQFIGQRLASSPVHVVRNWSHVDLPTGDSRHDTRAHHGWADDDIVVLHAGNMGAKQGLDNVLAAAEVAEQRGSRVRFVLLGDGNQRARLQSLARSDRLQFIDPLDDELFGQTLLAADLLLVHERPGLTEMSVPSKLTTYFATGLPVVAAVDETSTTAEEMSSSGAGPRVGPADPDALVRVCEELADDPEAKRAYGGAAQAYRIRTLTEGASVDAFETALRAALRSSLAG